MPNLKSPLLSLGASGTLGQAITFTKRRGQNIAEKKPELPYFLTLPVQYQRWLYQDYSYLWSEQSQATKDIYRSAGVRFHLTAFQYWMKYQLTNLPDIGGMWHLDEKGGAIAHDYSRNENHGTIVGCTPGTGAIDGAQGFDGINNYINCGNHVSLRPPVITAETFIITPTPLPSGIAGTEKYFLSRYDTPAGKRVWRLGLSNQHGALDFVDQLVIIFRKADGSGIAYIGYYATRLLPGTKYHVAYSFETGTLIFYVNGLPVTLTVAFGALENSLALSDVNLTVGGRLVGGVISAPLEHTQDHLIIWNRVLSPAQILMHADRSWPPVG